MLVLYTTSVRYGPKESHGYMGHIQNVTQRLRKRGHRVVLFACRSGAEPECGASPSESSDLDCVYVSALPQSMVDVARFNLAYWRHLSRRSHLRPDVIYCRFGLAQFAPIAYARAKKIPLVIEVNGVPDQDRKLNWLRSWLIGWAFRSADRMVVKSNSAGEYFRSRYQIPKERCVTIANGVDCGIYAPQTGERKLLPRGRPVVGYVGALLPHWDFDLLGRAAPAMIKEIPECLFAIVGEGPLAQRIKEQFEESGLSDHLLMPGPVSYAEAARYMAECDILVAPLKPLPRNEMSSPLKVYHYLATETPSVASDMEVMRQFEGSGLIKFEPDRPDALAGTLIECLQRPPQQRKELGRQGRSFIEERFTWDHTVANIEQLIEQAIR